MKHALIKTSILIAVSTVALACSSSSNNAASTGKPDASPGSGGSTSSGAGGTAGGTASGGSSTSGGGTSAGAGGAAITGCTLTPCEGKKILGQSLTACCLTATTCGISSPAYMGGACLSADLLKQVPDASSLTETIDLDPKCPDQSLGDAGAGFAFDAGAAGALKGCCDKTNVCGIAFKASFGGLNISQCVTPADAARLGMGAGVGAGVDAGPTIPCTYK